MPGIFGAASLEPDRLRAVRFDDGLSRLRLHPELTVSTCEAADGGARLGAVDLGIAPGSGVPARAPDGSLAVVHGEIASLPGRDVARLVLDAYRDDPAALGCLAGSYALAIWDAPARTLVLANDRFGLRNVYYTVDGGLLAFAPLVSAVLAMVPGKDEIDLGAVADFLTFEHVLGDATLLRRVRALPPATIARFDGRRLALERYWTPRYRAPAKASLAELTSELEQRLERAVRRAIDGPARAGLPVSGGLDSRALLAVARRAGLSAPCFTYGIAGSDDLRYGTELARLVGAEHHRLELEPGFIRARAAEMAGLTDGMHLALNAHAAVLQQCAAWCDVLVLGNGGDCALDRLWWWPDEPADEDDFADRMYQRIRVTRPEVAEQALAPALLDEAREGSRRRLGDRLARYPGDVASDRADAYNVGERHWRWVLQGVPAQTTHLEFREPFYDYAVVDFALGVPAALRAGRRLHVELIRRHAPDLARVPRQGGLPITTSRWRTAACSRLRRVRRAIDDVRDRWRDRPVIRGPRLTGFADYDFELRAASRALLEDVVLAPHTLERGWYRPDALRRLVDEHVSGRTNHGRALGAIATLELWLTRFARGDAHA